MFLLLGAPLRTPSGTCTPLEKHSFAQHVFLPTAYPDLIQTYSSNRKFSWQTLALNANVWKLRRKEREHEPQNTPSPHSPQRRNRGRRQSSPRWSCWADGGEEMGARGWCYRNPPPWEVCSCGRSCSGCREYVESWRNKKTLPSVQAVTSSRKTRRLTSTRVVFADLGGKKFFSPFWIFIQKKRYFGISKRSLSKKALFSGIQQRMTVPRVTSRAAYLVTSARTASQQAVRGKSGQGPRQARPGRPTARKAFCDRN